MEKQAQVKFRLEAISYKKSSRDFDKVRNLLPKPTYYHLIDDIRILDNGNIFPKPNSKTLVNFTTVYNTNDIEECTTEFVKYWNEYSQSIAFISQKHNYNFYLNIEITVYNLHYPSLTFNKYFIDFLSTLNIEMNFYFYNDQE